MGLFRTWPVDRLVGWSAGRMSARSKATSNERVLRLMKRALGKLESAIAVPNFGTLSKNSASPLLLPLPALGRGAAWFDLRPVLCYHSLINLGGGRMTIRRFEEAACAAARTWLPFSTVVENDDAGPADI